MLVCCQSVCHGSKNDVCSSARGQFSATEGRPSSVAGCRGKDGAEKCQT